MAATLAIRPSIILEDYMHLAMKIAFRYRPKVYEDIRDTEVYSIACEELLKAVSSYREGDFSRYAWRIMRNGILQKIRFEGRKKRSAKFCQLTEKQWESIRPQNLDKSNGSVELLSKILAICPTDTKQDVEDKKILIDFYIDGKSAQSIANQMSVTRMTIHNRMNRIMEKLRKGHKRDFDEIV